MLSENFFLSESDALAAFQIFQKLVFPAALMVHEFV